MITRNDLIEILNKHNEIVEYAVENFDVLKQRADNAEIIKYGTDSVALGCLYPKIRKKICRSQYGRFLKKIPNTAKYTIYEFTAQMTPLRIKRVCEEKYSSSSETLYFFQLNNELYAVPFLGESNKYYISTNCYRFTYKNEKLSQFCLFDKSRVNLMEFDYINYPHIHMVKHDYLILRYNPQKDYQYKIYEYDYDEDDKGKILNLVQGNTSIIS